jgi:hypothetical protein
MVVQSFEMPMSFLQEDAGHNVEMSVLVTRAVAIPGSNDTKLEHDRVSLPVVMENLRPYLLSDFSARTTLRKASFSYSG